MLLDIAEEQGESNRERTPANLYHVLFYPWPDDICSLLPHPTIQMSKPIKNVTFVLALVVLVPEGRVRNVSRFGCEDRILASREEIDRNVF